MHNVGLGILGVQPTKEVEMLEIAIPKTLLSLMQCSSLCMSFQLMPTANSTSRTLLKPLKLTDSNFASKVNPSQKYPACEVDTENLFDEDGDPIFQPQIPVSLEAYALTTGRRNLIEKLDRP